MSVKIHPQALVEKGAILEEGVVVDKGAIIRKDAYIGKGCYIGPYALIEGSVRLGENCRISSYAVIGSCSQDLKYKGDKTYVKIGKNNVIREFVTINAGTEPESSTVIGEGNLIMAYSHIAHNCNIGNNCILANCATLAGCVEVQDNVVIGGLVAVHQFVRIGSYAIIGGCSKVVQDIPPYSLCDGHPAQVRGVNIIGLKRKGFSSQKIDILKKVFKILFFSNLSFSGAIQEIQKMNLASLQEVNNLISFIRSSKRGICRPK